MHGASRNPRQNKIILRQNHSEFRLMQRQLRNARNIAKTFPCLEEYLFRVFRVFRSKKNLFSSGCLICDPAGAGQVRYFPELAGLIIKKSSTHKHPLIPGQKRKHKFQNFIRLKACKNSAQGSALGPTARIKTGYKFTVHSSRFSDFKP